ncbi:hypothetical protein N658DRAFT_297268 [Parathielavia hyrcaniae]|uniref:Uncharacterized protein n=1 Tax=Parathielavia hyrcaniae TaxID=113614 RepID=A0AAN6PXH8_9PEZI|nr:hypothetical protein N658DRAFT_297268 [Parathielavia hyrcaniae]
MARLTPASESARLAGKLEEQQYLVHTLADAWSAEAAPRIVQDFWRFACCRQCPILQVDELQALAAFHSATERVLADFVMRATSDQVPDSLHSPPRLLSCMEAGLVMAQLSMTERTRIFRAFYCGQLMNYYFTSPKARELDEATATRVKALCLWATWMPWEIREILTLHSYFRHQHELILEQVNADFIYQLEAAAPPLHRKDSYTETRSSIPPPPIERCICVDSKCVNDPQVNRYIERQALLGLQQLLRLLRQDRRGRR